MMLPSQEVFFQLGLPFLFLTLCFILLLIFFYLLRERLARLFIILGFLAVVGIFLFIPFPQEYLFSFVFPLLGVLVVFFFLFLLLLGVLSHPRRRFIVLLHKVHRLMRKGNFSKAILLYHPLHELYEHLREKKSFTEELYAFFLEVRLYLLITRALYYYDQNKKQLLRELLPEIHTLLDKVDSFNSIDYYCYCKTDNKKNYSLVIGVQS